MPGNSKAVSIEYAIPLTGYLFLLKNTFYSWLLPSSKNNSESMPCVLLHEL